MAGGSYAFVSIAGQPVGSFSGVYIAILFLILSVIGLGMLMVSWLFTR
jgi:hypothetical protein